MISDDRWNEWCRQMAEKSFKDEFVGKAALMSPASNDGIGSGPGWWVHRLDGSGDFTIPDSEKFDYREACIAATEIDCDYQLVFGD